MDSVERTWVRPNKGKRQRCFIRPNGFATVVNHWTLDDITTYYDIPTTRCIRKLAKLDRLKIIELLPKNRIKLLVAPNFDWRPNTPIQRFFHEKIEANFFRSHFDKDTDKLIVINGMLSHLTSELMRFDSRIPWELQHVCLPIDHSRELLSLPQPSYEGWPSASGLPPNREIGRGQGDDRSSARLTNTAKSPTAAKHRMVEVRPSRRPPRVDGLQTQPSHTGRPAKSSDW